MRFILPLCVALAGFTTSAASRGALSFQASEKGPLLKVRTIGEEGIQGDLVSLSMEEGLVLEADRERRRIPASDLVTVSRFNSSNPAPRDHWWGADVSRESVAIDVAGGDRILGRLMEGPPEHVSVDVEQWGTLTIPLERIARLQFFSASLPAYTDSVRWFRAEADSTDDRILLTNGDTVRGFVSSLDRDGIHLSVDDEATTIPLRLAVAARLVHPAPQPIEGPHALISLVDGQRYTATQLQWSPGHIRARTPAGENLGGPGERVDSIEFLGGRWEWLSDKAPSRAEHIPMLSTQWRYEVNRNVLQGPLKVAGGHFARGLGVHSKSVLAYELGGAYKEFVASFGLDDSSGGSANVRVLVLVDGRQRFAQDDVVQGPLYGPIRVNIAEAKTLELIVDFGRNGDIQDRFNWIEPALVR